jgi:hypothetical protein
MVWCEILFNLTKALGLQREYRAECGIKFMDISHRHQ